MSLVAIDVSPSGDWALSRSPDLHQNLPFSPPKPCTGVHQWGCDLKGVEGEITPKHSLLTQMTTYEHFGFDEAEPEVTTSEVELISTDDSQIVDNMNPRFSDFVPDSLRPSTYVIEGGQALREKFWKAWVRV